MTLRGRQLGGRRGSRGLTLVEVLLVVALIALLSGAIVFGSGMFAASRRRAAATLIISGVRLGITRANATGRPVRMVFDLDEERVMLQESTGRMLFGDDLWQWVDPENISRTGGHKPGPGRGTLDQILQRLERL